MDINSFWLDKGYKKLRDNTYYLISVNNGIEVIVRNTCKTGSGVEHLLRATYFIELHLDNDVYTANATSWAVKPSEGKTELTEEEFIMLREECKRELLKAELSK